MKFVNHVCILTWIFHWYKSVLDARDYIHKLTARPKQDYKKLFGYKTEPGSKTPVSGVSSQGIALIDRLLAFDHRTRPSAEEALGNYFISLKYCSIGFYF